MDISSRSKVEYVVKRQPGSPNSYWDSVRHQYARVDEIYKISNMIDTQNHFNLYALSKHHFYLIALKYPSVVYYAF